MSKKLERDVNAQTLRQTERLERLLENGDQETYERALEYIRARRRQSEQARKRRENYAQVSERVEQSDYDVMDED